MKLQKLSIVLLLAIAVCAVILLAPRGVLASGMTYYLNAQNGSDSNSGSATAPWKTLQKAVSTIQSGDTVVLARGIYRVTSPFAFGPAGTANASTTFKAAPGARPIVTDAKGLPPAVSFRGDYIQLRGLWLGGSLPPNGRTISTGGSVISHGIQLINNTIFGYETGIVIGSSEYLTISGNRFVNTGYGNYAHAMYLSGGCCVGQLSQHVIVDNNVIIGNGSGGYGITVYNSTGPQPHNFIITRNFITGMRWGSSTYGSDNLIANNFYWRETGITGAIDTKWGPQAEDTHSFYLNNVMESGGWMVAGNGIPPKPSWTGDTFANNAHQLTGKPVAAMYAITGTHTINLTTGYELTKYGVSRTALDTAIAAVRKSFSQPLSIILADTTIERNLATLKVKIPSNSPLYKKGVPWFGKPVNVGPDAVAPASESEYWAAIRALGLDEYDRFADKVTHGTATPLLEVTNTPTRAATNTPSREPTNTPTRAATNTPIQVPSNTPTLVATNTPTRAATNTPTRAATNMPTQAATDTPTRAATNTPTLAPTKAATVGPTQTPAPASANLITLNPAISFQKITGWEATAQVGEGTASFPYYKNTLFNLAANDLGINRVRLEVHPTSTSNMAPSFTFLDGKIDNIVVPMRAQMQARGETLWVNLCYVAYNDTTNLKSNPQLYAQYVLSVFQHMKTKYGFVPDSVEVELEPDSVAGGQWTPAQLGNALVAAGNLLKSNGYLPKFVAPSTTNMSTAVTDFDGMLSVSGVLSYLSEISYHRYAGVSLTSLQTLAQRAQTNHISTSMLEHIGSSYVDLHQDLKVGNNSAWQQYTLAYPTTDNGAQYYTVNTTNVTSPIVNLSSTAKFLRQYFKFIRIGATRIDAQSNISYFDPVAFVNSNGKYVVVVKSAYPGLPSDSSFSIKGLPAGTYGMKYTTAQAYNVDLTDVTINAGALLTTRMSGSGVITIYQR